MVFFWRLLSVGLLAVCVSLSGCGDQKAQGDDTALNIGMTLEPPGLDPTANAASATGEIVLYNIFETLTKIHQDGMAHPLLAKSWQVSEDQKTWVFRLRQGVTFHNGVPFNAETVKFTLSRAAADDSTNKDKEQFANIAQIETPDAQTVVLHLRHPNPNLPFLLGQATAIMVEPSSAGENHAQPVGTGPYRLGQWNKGSSLSLEKWDAYRTVQNIALQRVQFRFIADTAAQAAALQAGDVDLFPRVQVSRSLQQFQQDSRFQVLIGASRAKTIMAMNHAHPKLADIRVRQAITAAIDRQAVIQAAVDGLGVPIGSFYVPSALGYIDLTNLEPYNPERAKELLRQAGAEQLTLTLKLPPPPYAKQAGEAIVAMLAQVGISVRVVNVEWAQWLSQVYSGAKDYDLTIISHVEPFDLGNFAKKGYYWNYQSDAFNALYARINQTGDVQERLALLAEAQKMVAEDAVAVYLYQPQWITVGKKELKGAWQDMPIFVNDLSTLSWKP